MAFSSDAALGITFFASAASIAWSAVFAWSRWLARPEVPSLPSSSVEYQFQQEQRLANIEHAVQAIAVEVERIGEGQRFTTRLLSERNSTDAARSRVAVEYRKVDTPH